MKSPRLRLSLLSLSIMLIGSLAHAATGAVHAAGASAAAVEAAPGDAPAWSVREHYTKYEYRIPMRDGTRLFTVVYVPKDSSKRYPFLMDRTPYGVGVRNGDAVHYGVDYYPASLGPGHEFETAGYIFVRQDVRGRFMSEGKWQEMTPHANAHRAPGQGVESEDMHDTVDWLLKNVAGNNGKVGILGISYGGFYTSASIINSHPAIKAASPQAPIADLFMGDDSYHGGAFMLSANFDFYAAFTEAPNPTPLPKTREQFDYGSGDAYAFFLEQLTLPNIVAKLDRKQQALLVPTIEHATYDAFWQSRNILPHLTNIRAAVLTVGGWFDAEDLQGTLNTYQAIGRQNRGIANGLVMGPWVHGGWARGDGAALGHVQFDAKTAEQFRKTMLFPFFEQHLKGVANPDPAPVHAFETGSNVWRSYAAWPPQQASLRTLYFGPNGTLSWQPPAAPETVANTAIKTASNTAPAAAFDEYVSDPKKPVPYIGYPATGVPQEYMVSDQRFASTRPDVLTYRSAPLEQDVTVAGPVTPTLFVSTSGSDADWVVKLIDVYPPEYPESATRARGRDVPPPGVIMAGYEQLVRGDPLRGKFRNSFVTPQPFTPGKMETVRYSMADVNHTFRRGHRIMVQVQSSWFPLVDLNPQTFVDIPHASAADFQKATQRVFRAPGMASGVALRVLPGVGER